VNWSSALDLFDNPILKGIVKGTLTPNINKLARGGLSRVSSRSSGGFIGPIAPRPAPSLEGRLMAVNIYGDQIPDEYGPPRRRRGRGITAHDLRSFRRVANLIRKYAAPVRHFKKHPGGHK